MKKNIYLCIRNDVMDSLKVGDIVEYKGRQWYMYSLYGSNLCRIIVLRDGKYTHIKNGEEYINANIVNLSIEEIKKV